MIQYNKQESEMEITLNSINEKVAEITLYEVSELRKKDGLSFSDMDKKDQIDRATNYNRMELMVIDDLVNKKGSITIENNLSNCSKFFQYAIAELLGVSAELRHKPKSRSDALKLAINEYYK